MPAATSTLPTHPDFEVAAVPGFLDCFADRFVSFELGLMKPDLDIFQHVTRVLGVDARRILFLDDNQLNVDSARPDRRPGGHPGGRKTHPAESRNMVTWRLES